ncbi:hypothetical protein EBU99_01950 [bacterium]|nr:hypothetical protein [bacterium]
MDLMKLLKAKSELLLAQKPREVSAGEKIVADLKIQFEAFLKDISKLDEFKNHNPLEGVKALAGEVLLEDEYGVLGTSPYLYLRIPGRRGLLLEPGEDDTLILSSATEARPIQRQWSGEVSSRVVFVRMPKPLASFKILELDTVRDIATSQTFLGTRFFESLLERLIVYLNDSSTLAHDNRQIP